MERSLFRQEALEFQRHHRVWGSVNALEPPSMTFTAWFLVILAIGFIAFLFWGQYSRKETAIGYLTPTIGTAKIFAPQRGTIKEVHVEEGRIVREGEPLLTVETNQIAENGSDVNATMLSTLEAQRSLLAQNIVGEEERGNSERERLTSLTRGLEAEITQLQGQIEVQGERQKVAEADLTAATHLRSKGFMTEVEYRRRQAQVLEQKQAMAALSQQLASRQNQLTETRFALQQLPTVMAQKVQALRNDLAVTEQRIVEVNGKRAYVIRAPAAGRVSTVQATVGQSVDPQRLQLEIIPEHAKLQAELYLPARAIGFVRPGQTVRVLYEAFPYQHFGAFKGHVERVSQTILTSANAAGPIALKEPAYRVTAALDSEEIEIEGKRIPLQPDMLLRADIILEKRSLMSWIVSPLTGVRM